MAIVGPKTFFFAMTVKGDAPVFATAIPQLFEALLDVFAPLDVTYRIDDGDFERIARVDPVRAYNTEPLWCDEELTRDALTKCDPALGTDVVAELWERIAGTAPRTFYISAEGALRFRAEATEEPAWYGRWRSNVLHELVTVSFTWTKDPLRGFEWRCPASGYPLTAVRPMIRGELADGDPAIAEANRAAIVPALCRVREALGFDREEVTWHNQGDYSGVLPDDRNAIWKHWLPRLRAS